MYANNISSKGFLLHFSFLVRNIFSGWSDLFWSEYLELWLGSILLIALVYIPFSLFARYKYFHNMIGNANPGSDDFFEFVGEGKSRLKIYLDKIIYIKSDDNYLDIVTLDHDNKLKTVVFRARLKSIEDQLGSYSQFFRIHRSYILNIQFLAEVNKADSLKVRYNDLELELPVSRQYRKELQNILK